MYYTAVTSPRVCCAIYDNNSYINCSEQQAHSRSVTLKYACIIIVIVIIISSSMNCAKVCGSAALCGCASGSMLAESARSSVQQRTWACMYGSARGSVRLCGVVRQSVRNSVQQCVR